MDHEQGSEIQTLLLEKFIETLGTPDSTLPRFETDKKRYGEQYDDVIDRFLSGLEASFRAFLCPEAILRWRLGGPKSLPLLLRAFASLAPVCNTPERSQRFGELSVRFHYFIILVIYVRRSYLNAKHLVASQPFHVVLPSSPITPLLDIWASNLENQLNAWATALDTGDIEQALKIFNAEVSWGVAVGKSELYQRVDNHPWYSVTKPGKPWSLKLGGTMSLFLSGGDWLTKVSINGASIQQLCNLGITAVVVAMAHSDILHWFDAPLWAAIAQMLSGHSNPSAATGLLKSRPMAPNVLPTEIAAAVPEHSYFPPTMPAPQINSAVPMDVDTEVERENQPAQGHQGGTGSHSNSPVPSAASSALAPPYPAPMRVVQARASDASTGEGATLGLDGEAMPIDQPLLEDENAVEAVADPGPIATEQSPDIKARKPRGKAAPPPPSGRALRSRNGTCFLVNAIYNKY